MIKYGKCIDPETAFVQGTRAFDENLKLFNLKFESGDVLTLQKIFFSYNIFDAQDKDRPIKTRILTETFGNHSNYLLTLHKLELADNIYSPFKN